MNAALRTSLVMAAVLMMAGGPAWSADKPAAAPAKPAATAPASSAKPAETKPTTPAAKPATTPAAATPAAKPAAAAPAKPAATTPAATKPAAAATTAKPAPATPAKVETKPAATAAAPAASQKPVSFKADIAPLLVQNCLACHGTSDPKGDYQLHTFTALMTPGASATDAVVAGKPDDSELLRLIASDDKSERMPKDGDAMPAEQVALIKRWIAEGAKYDAGDAKAELVSIVPRKAHPNPPESYRTAVPVTALAFEPAGKELAVGGYHEITIWNPADGKLIRRIKDVEQRTYGLAYSADGKTLAAAGGTPGVSGEVALYDPVKGTMIRRLGTMSDLALGLAFSPDGKRLAACSADRSIRVYDLATGKESLLIEDHADWVMTVAWNADGTKLVSGSRDKTSKLFDAKTGDSETTYPGHSETVLGAAFAPDGKSIITGGSDKKIHVWNPADGKQIGTIAGGGEVYRVQIVDGEIWSCSSDKTAKRHKLADRALSQTYSGHADYVFSLAVNPTAKLAATAGFDGEVKIWNLTDNKNTLSFRAAPGLVIAAAK
jgi:sugar lactone lactonase YvrE